MKKIAITTGDPAGIGPEITAKAFQFRRLNSSLAYIIYGNCPSIDHLEEPIQISEPKDAKKPGKLYQIKIGEKIKPGNSSKKSGEIAYEILKRTASDLNSKEIDAVVTNPISKTEIHKTHPKFIGHTEFYANESSTKDVIMSFWGPHFNLSLLTTHNAIKDIPKVLPKEIIKKKLKIIYAETIKYLKKPKFGMLAINPHAGENGAFGNHDEILKTVLEELKEEENIEIDGPFPADTFFAYKATDYNMIISAYHDQGLIPFKMISMEQGVNVTLGLPFIRTSVDHGTAFDIAGQDIASEKSLIAAINQAEKMLKIENHQTSIYSLFSEYYDNYMKYVDYEDWEHLILKKFTKYNSSKPEKLLELAAGTCNVSSRFRVNNISCDASDISSSMLKVASQKPYSPNLYQANMLDPLPANRYDLIILLFDSINYLKDESEISELLENTYNSLQKNGIFIFDISTIKNCRDNFSNYQKLRYKDGNSFMHIAKYYPIEMKEKHKLLFYKKKGFLYEHITEKHTQTIFHVKTIKKLIKKSQFKLLEITSIIDNSNLKNDMENFLDRNHSRLFFILRKI